MSQVQDKECHCDGDLMSTIIPVDKAVIQSVSAVAGASQDNCDCAFENSFQIYAPACSPRLSCIDQLIMNVYS